MASSTSSEKFPCPTELDVNDFVPNLLHEGNYKKWKSLMEDFIYRRGLIGFIDGTAIDEVRNEYDIAAWEKSDNLVQAWILATVSDDIHLRLRKLKSAEAIWGKLEYTYDVNSWQIDLSPDIDEEAGNGQAKSIELHKAVIGEEWEKALQIIEEHPDAITKAITSSRENVLIVAVQSTSPGRDDFVEKLLPKMTKEEVFNLVDSEKSTALHYAALLDNRIAAKMLVLKNPELPHAFNGEKLIPLQSAAWCGHRDMVLYLMAVTKPEILLRDDVAPTLFCYLISGELYDIASYLLQKKPGRDLIRMETFATLAEKHSSFPSGTSLGWWERLIYWGVPTISKGNDHIEKLIEEAGRQGGDTGTGGGDTQNVTAAEAVTQEGDTQNVGMANCCVSVSHILHLLIHGVAKKLGVPMRSEGNDIEKLIEKAKTQGGDTQNVAAAQSHVGVPTRSGAGTQGGDTETQGGDTQNVAAAPSHVGVPTRSEAVAQGGDTQNVATANCCTSVSQILHLLIQGVAKILGVPKRSEGNDNEKLIEKAAGTEGGDTQNDATTTQSHVGVPTSSEAGTQGGDTSISAAVMQTLCVLIWVIAIKHVPCVRHIQEKREKQDHALQLVRKLCTEVATFNRSEVERIYKLVLRKAVRVGIPDELVKEIAASYPSALFFKDVDNVNFIKYAIMYRRERVFNLIHDVGAGWRCITGLDESNNNGLHLAARLGRKQQINLKASAAGAILHMQREMQWFQEVKTFTQPGEIDRRNDDDKTPEELFSDTHQDLIKEGEQWMKNTAGACTIVSALIVAMAFAAAITVPGGNNGTSGRPVLSAEKAFIIFGISDALALLSSITSSLMFLLILTSRYAEEDFLLTLPMRLIFGLLTLFFSILSTMTAFSAILYLVFGGDEAWILIPIGVLASIPALLFVALQFPLLIEMIQSTYGGGFFVKRRNRQQQVQIPK